MESPLNLLFGKRKTNPKKLAVKTPDQGFIPYVCHYDENTILTKNGELMKIIRITGFENSSTASEFIALRELVRESITDHIKENKFAFWFNTIRRKKNIISEIERKSQFSDFFSAEVNKSWIQQNGWNDQYVNELYITIIIEGFDTSITNLHGFLRSFSYIYTKSLHGEFLAKSHKKLTEVVNLILSDLEDHGAKLLGIKEWEGVLYSEQMRFFGKILNLYEDRYPLTTNDISYELANHRMAFGDRELEVSGHDHKNFAAILSVKEYLEISVTSLDRILQLPFEFIITQSFDFSFNKKDLAQHKYADYILRVSGDEDFRSLSGIEDFIEDKDGLETDYGQLQTTMMLINNSHKHLEEDVKMIIEQLGFLGLVTVREDIFLEHCFWAQLPGNFHYLKRQKIIDTKRVGGFAALHNFPTGKMLQNHWGPAITMLKTALNTPYFFSFHDFDLGHTLIIGPKNSGKTTLLNFLLCQARRVKHKLFYLDFDNSAKCFISAIGGEYHTISRNKIDSEEFLTLTPTSIRNKDFLTSFFKSLVIFAKDPVPEHELDAISQISERIASSFVDSFATAVEMFNVPETQIVYRRLKVWNNDKLSYIFTGKSNLAAEINWSAHTNAFDLTDIATQKPILVPVVNYLLHKIENELDGSPTLLVLKNAWNFLDSKILGPQISDMMIKMRSKNCVMIFTSDNLASIKNSPFTADIRKNVATEIFMRNDNASESDISCYKNNFGLSDGQTEIITAVNSGTKHFLLIKSSASIASSLDLSGCLPFLKILSADSVTLAAMNEILSSDKIGARKPKPESWLPKFFEVLEGLEKSRITEEKQKMREKDLELQRRIDSMNE